MDYKSPKLLFCSMYLGPEPRKNQEEDQDGIRERCLTKTHMDECDKTKTVESEYWWTKCTRQGNDEYRTRYQMKFGHYSEQSSRIYLA